MKFKKLIAAASVVAMLGSITAYADTYINDEFKDGYGKYMLSVHCDSNMRDCEAVAWGSSSNNYCVNLVCTFYDGQEVVIDTGFLHGEARVTRSYEYTEDYVAKMYVRNGIYIRGSVTVSGS